MTKNVRRAAALILASALFSAGAWGQTTTIRQWFVTHDSCAPASCQPIKVAKEYFGDPEGRTVGQAITEGVPKIVLSVHDTTGTGAGHIDEGNVAEIKFTLTGATFAGVVSANSLFGDEKAHVRVAIVEGGAVGDPSVTFEVEAVEDTTDEKDVDGSGGIAAGGLNSPANSGKLIFVVPPLSVTGAALGTRTGVGAGRGTMTDAYGAAVTASIRSTVAGSNPFPNEIQGRNDDPAGEEDDFDPITPSQSQVYETGMDALNFYWQEPIANKAYVNVEDRGVIMKMEGSATDPSAMDPEMAATALRLGSINAADAGNAVKDLGGMDAALMSATELAADSGLSGDAMVTVAGPFQMGDAVYLGGEAMMMSGGMATGSVSVESLLMGDGMAVIYVPGGVDDLTHASMFTAMATLDFDDASNMDKPAGPSTGMLVYYGLTNQGYAYGIVKGGGSDTSYVRMTCTQPEGVCRVFADCTDQAGGSHFGELEAIPNGATGVANSQAIADALGSGDDWTMGRGACDLLSSGKLEVQHMVRSGTTLVNSSVVINKEPAPVYKCMGDGEFSVLGEGAREITSMQTCNPQ